MDINIDPNSKTIDVYVNNISISKLKQVVSRFKSLSDYEIFIHNPNQTTNLIDVYEGNVSIDNLGIK